MLGLFAGGIQFQLELSDPFDGQFRQAGYGLGRKAFAKHVQGRFFFALGSTFGSALLFAFLQTLLLSKLVEGIVFDVNVKGHLLGDVKYGSVYVSEYGQPYQLQDALLELKLAVGDLYAPGGMASTSRKILS
jgi:hypothetical protein